MTPEDASIIPIALLVVYFIPTISAMLRHHHQIRAIFLLNLLLGWTVLGWIVAVIWAATAVRRDDVPHQAPQPARSSEHRRGPRIHPRRA